VDGRANKVVLKSMVGPHVILYYPSAHLYTSYLIKAGLYYTYKGVGPTVEGPSVTRVTTGPHKHGENMLP